MPQSQARQAPFEAKSGCPDRAVSDMGLLSLEANDLITHHVISTLASRTS